MTGSRDWYGADWKTLRTQLLKLCMRHCLPLLKSFESIQSNIHEELDHFVWVVREDIEQRIPDDKLELWGHAMGLMQGIDVLEKELVRDRKVLSGKKKNNGKSVDRTQAFARKLKQFFEASRRQIIADDLGVSKNKVKTWERLDKISRELNKNNTSGNRCNDEHFGELARFVKLNHGQDKNLPRRAETVKGYFYRFSGDCSKFIDDEFTMEKISYQEAQNLFKDVGMAELTSCLIGLDESEYQLLDLFFDLGLSKIQYRTTEDFLINNKISLEQLKENKNMLLNKLRRCLELNLESGHGRV